MYLTSIADPKWLKAASCVSFRLMGENMVHSDRLQDLIYSNISLKQWRKNFCSVITEVISSWRLAKKLCKVFFPSSLHTALTSPSTLVSTANLVERATIFQEPQVIHFGFIHRAYFTPCALNTIEALPSPSCTQCTQNALATFFHMVWRLWLAGLTACGSRAPHTISIQRWLHDFTHIASMDHWAANMHQAKTENMSQWISK